LGFWAKNERVINFFIIFLNMPTDYDQIIREHPKVFLQSWFPEYNRYVSNYLMENFQHHLTHSNILGRIQITQRRVNHEGRIESINFRSPDGILEGIIRYIPSTPTSSATIRTEANFNTHDDARLRQYQRLCTLFNLLGNPARVQQNQ
jgi:hypothetical protein